MVLHRASPLRGGFRQGLFRQAAPRIRSRVWQQTSRRTYADSHSTQASSDLPWMIGSVVVTVPAAAWLWQQGPAGEPHGIPDKHGHSAPENETTGPAKDAPEEATTPTDDEGGDGAEEEQEGGDDKQEEGEDKQEGGEEKQDDGGDQKKDDGGDEKQAEGKSQGAPGGGDQKSPPGASEAKGKDAKGGDEKPDQSSGDKSDQEDKSDDSGSEDSGKDTPDTSDDEGGPSQINKNNKKGAGEQQRGGHPEPERKGDKDKQSDFSGGKHPYIDHPEKSKKGEGVTETAKIHGTVDVNRPAR